MSPTAADGPPPNEIRSATAEQAPDDWQPPGSAGEVGAVQSIGTIAAPFLAGFSITLVGVIVATAHFAHGGIAELLLTGAALFMVGSMQFSLWARQNEVSPSFYDEWFPVATEKRVQYNKAEQATLKRKWEFWSGLTRSAYNAGILLLLAGLLTILLPPEGITLRTARGAAAGLAAAGLAAEYIWLIGARMQLAFITLPQWGPWRRRLAAAIWFAPGLAIAVAWLALGLILCGERGRACRANARCSLHSIGSLGFRRPGRPWSRAYAADGGLGFLVWAIGRVGLAGAYLILATAFSLTVVGVPAAAAAVRIIQLTLVGPESRFVIGRTATGRGR